MKWKRDVTRRGYFLILWIRERKVEGTGGEGLEGGTGRKKGKKKKTRRMRSYSLIFCIFAFAKLTIGVPYFMRQMMKFN